MKVGIYFDTFSNSETEWIKNYINTIGYCIDDLVIINNFSSNKLTNLIKLKEKKYELRDISGIRKSNSLDEVEKIFKNNLKDLDAIFVSKIPMVKNFDSMIKKYINNKNNINSNFNISFRIYKSIAMISTIAKLNIRLYHLIIDPQEIDYSKYFLFQSYKRVFQNKTTNNCYIPLYEPSLLQNCKNINKENIKEYNLFFIATAYTNDRHFIFEYEKLIKKKKEVVFKIIGKDKELRKNKIKQDKYYEEISKSKYTIIIKAYDNKSFSTTRFMEAIVLNCIPLILDDVCLDELKNTFYDIYILAKKLVVNIKDVNYIVNDKKQYNKRYKILKAIKDTKSFKKITNYNEVKKLYSKLNIIK